MTTSNANVIKKIHLRYSLEGRKYLHQDEISTISVLNPTNGKSTDKIFVERISSYPLRKVTVEQLQQIRAAKIPSFVLKENDDLYYAKIDKDVRLMSENILGKHRCANPGEECRRLSAAKDEDGGCAKVRNRATHIEKYSWIPLGYETFGTQQDALVVINCNHYQKLPPREKLNANQLATLKISIAQHIDPDVKTTRDVRRLHEKNAPSKTQKK